MSTTSWLFPPGSAVVRPLSARAMATFVWGLGSWKGQRGKGRKHCVGDKAQMTLFHFDSMDRELRGSRGRAPGKSELVF